MLKAIRLIAMSEVPYWKTKKAADSILRKFFAGTMNDEVTVDYIFNVSKRDLRAKNKNSAWLSNKLSSLRIWNYIDTHYSETDRKRVGSISLTPQGREALGRTSADSTKNVEAKDHTNEVTPESVYRDIKILRQQNPSFEVVFEFRPKEGLTVRHPANLFR